jgi:hypothetical protein
MSYSSDILTTSLSTPPKQQRSQHTSYDSVPNTPGIPRKKGRPRRSTATLLQPVAPVAPVHPDTPSAQSREQPAAFPSLIHEQPLYTHVSNHYGLQPRVGASTNKERKVWLKQVEAMYDNTAFPAEVDIEQKAWYEELNSRWLPGKVSTQVSRSELGGGPVSRTAVPASINLRD